MVTYTMIHTDDAAFLKWSNVKIFLQKWTKKSSLQYESGVTKYIQEGLLCQVMTRSFDHPPLDFHVSPFFTPYKD